MWYMRKGEEEELIEEVFKPKVFQKSFWTLTGTLLFR